MALNALNIAFIEKKKKFIRRDWSKKNKNEGGGTSFILSGGNLFEKDRQEGKRSRRKERDTNKLNGELTGNSKDGREHETKGTDGEKGERGECRRKKKRDQEKKGNRKA